MAKRKTFNLVVITPEQKMLEQAVDSAVLPAHDGEIGILPQRAPIVCELGVGRLRYRSASGSGAFFIEGGFGQVLDDTVTVLTDQAIPVDQITAETIAQAEKTAHDAAAAHDVERTRRARQRVRVLRALRSH